MKITDDILERIVSCELFSSVSLDELSSVLNEDNVSFESFSGGELIYSSEKYVPAVGFLLSGSAKVMKKDREVLVGRLFENDIFGCQSLFLGGAYFTNEIISSGKTTVLFISKSAIVVLMQKVNNFSLDYIRYLSGRIYFLNRRIIGFTGGTAESRLADFLLSSFGDYKTYVLDMPMSHLAVSLDIGRASLYRALDSLIESGAVEKNGKIIRLTNRDVLISFLKRD